MKKACFAVDKFFQKNRIFESGNVSFNRDDCLMPFILLKNSFADRGFDLSTQDINPIDKSEVVLYFNLPPGWLPPDLPEKSFLIIFESELISPQNWQKENHKVFKKIFTWNDEVLDGSKYVKSNVPMVFIDGADLDSLEKRKFCCLIAGNKMVDHPLELYSKRIEAVRWFEQNHPDHFSLYGVGWNELLYPGRGLLSRYAFLNPLKKLIDGFAPKFSSYRGQAQSKFETLKQYRFSICYENACNIPGYITEKIFDCFFAGCIPVYWGASNVTEHIPADCFIDKRDFATYEELFRFMKSLSDDQCRNYVQAIKRFLGSSQGKKFSAHYFAENIAREVLGNKLI